LPPRPFFSIRSFAVNFGGTASLRAKRLLHLQSCAGQPQVGQIRPASLE
jgi:hypothetical protein